MCTSPVSNQGPLGPKSDALTTAPLRHLDYAPNFEKVDGAYCFWSVRGCVGGCVTLFVPTVTFQLLKLES